MSTDPLMRSIEMTVADLRFRNKQLTEEVDGYTRMVSRLKVRIAELEAKASARASRREDPEEVVEVSILVKETDQWGARDFLAYFQHLHLQWCGVPYHFSRNIYEAALSQVKRMRKQYGLTNLDMRAMFDFHFTKTFNEKFTPSIAYISGPSGVNRYYGSTLRGKTPPAPSETGYTRRQMEAKETWDASEDSAENVENLNRKLRQRKKR